jgi:DNA polymerase-3 subunit delta'
VDGFLTVGQPAAVAAVHAMLATRVSHAVLLVGPASIGKHTLARDLATALLCTGATGAERPCRACRGCRLVEHGNHPDLHLLAPSGPGMQIRIGEDQHPEPGTIRRLASDLALLPVEGGERVAIIRDAHRMNDVAQSALLKTLEEPPPATTLILCADDEDQLLPTIRSRCARIRLGTVGTRDVERLLAALDLADAPTAARLARLSGGRPGVAVAYASAPDAERIRVELARTLLDLLRRRRADRLGASKDLLARAMALGVLLEPPASGPVEPAKRRGKGRAEAAAGPVGDAPDAQDPGPEQTADDGGGTKATATERRKALALLLEIWRDLAHDLACVERGAIRSVRDTALLEELEGVVRELPPGTSAEVLGRLVRASELLDVNVTPELVLDVLLVRWTIEGRAA